MNNLSAIGNIGKDAEVRYIPSGEAIAIFSFALTSGYGQKQITTWLTCNLWGKRAETLSPMLLKGTRIGINGELVNRPYITKEGIEKHSLELRVSDVTLLGSKQDATQANTQNNAPKAAQSEPAGGFFDDFDSDVIPF